MSLNLLAYPKFHTDLIEALKTISVDDMTDIDFNTLPEEILDLVNSSKLFQKLLVLTKKAVETGDKHIADGMKLFFIEMAERRLGRQ